MKIAIASLLLLLPFWSNADDFREIDQAVHAGVALKIYQSQDNRIVEFRVTNSDSITYGVKISTDLDNMRSNVALPLRGMIPARTSREIPLFQISCIDCSKGFYFRNLQWHLQLWAPPVNVKNALGRPFTRGYGLPWPKGKTFTVDNGFNGYGGHKNEFAVDFKMPEGSPVMAARDGTVISIEERYSQGGNDPALSDKGNFVHIQHADGTVARYAHFRQNGVLVEPGQKVSEGDQIGWSGNVGWSTDPHLHFDVVAADSQGNVRTMPFTLKPPHAAFPVEPKLGMRLTN